MRYLVQYRTLGFRFIRVVVNSEDELNALIHEHQQRVHCWYREIEVPVLEQGQVFVSHVGDGEYEFNTFGSIHTKLDALLLELQKATTGELLVTKYNDREDSDIYIVDTNGIVQARITIEQIDPNEFVTGSR